MARMVGANACIAREAYRMYAQRLLSTEHLALDAYNTVGITDPETCYVQIGYPIPTIPQSVLPCGEARLAISRLPLIAEGPFRGVRMRVSLMGRTTNDNPFDIIAKLQKLIAPEVEVTTENNFVGSLVRKVELKFDPRGPVAVVGPAPRPLEDLDKGKIIPPPIGESRGSAPTAETKAR